MEAYGPGVPHLICIFSGAVDAASRWRYFRWEQTGAGRAVWRPACSAKPGTVCAWPRVVEVVVVRNGWIQEMWW